MIQTKNVGVRLPVGLLKEIQDILQKEQSFLSVQEFIRMATKKEVERWKMENKVK